MNASLVSFPFQLDLLFLVLCLKHSVNFYKFLKINDLIKVKYNFKIACILQWS